MTQSETLQGLEWKDVELAADRAAGYRFGPLSIRVERAGPEWRIAWKRSPLPASNEAWTPEGADSARLTGTGAETLIRFAPALPDKPLVLRLENPLLLLRDSKARIYAAIPVRVRASLLSGENEITVADMPTVVLSRSWLGKPTAGQLCYWKRSRAAPQTDDSLGAEHAFCPVTLLNRDSRDIALERLEIPLPKLGLWDAGGRLWTGSVRISFRSASDFDASVSDDRPPEEKPDARRVAAPRSAGRSALDLKDINPLRILSEWRR